MRIRPRSVATSVTASHLRTEHAHRTPPRPTTRTVSDELIAPNAGESAYSARTRLARPLRRIRLVWEHTRFCHCSTTRIESATFCSLPSWSASIFDRTTSYRADVSTGPCRRTSHSGKVDAVRALSATLWKDLVQDDRARRAAGRRRPRSAWRNERSRPCQRLGGRVIATPSGSWERPLVATFSRSVEGMPIWNPDRCSTVAISDSARPVDADGTPQWLQGPVSRKLSRSRCGCGRSVACLSTCRPPRAVPTS